MLDALIEPVKFYSSIAVKTAEYYIRILLQL